MYPSLEQRLVSKVLTTQQVREVDQMAIRDYGMHSLVLMENAGLGSANWICGRFPSPQRTVVLCGSGNNGGDGLVVTRHLRNRGWDCQALILGPREKLSPDARHHYDLLTAMGGSAATMVSAEDNEVVSRAIAGAELIVDAMLGTGASGNPRSPIADWILLANRCSAFRLAIDLPTGVQADTGECGQPTFQANATLTFVSLKPSMTCVDSASIFGPVHVLPIGIPEQLILRLLRDDTDPNIASQLRS